MTQQRARQPVRINGSRTHPSMAPGCAIVACVLLVAPRLVSSFVAVMVGTSLLLLDGKEDSPSGQGTAVSQAPSDSSTTPLAQAMDPRAPGDTDGTRATDPAPVSATVRRTRGVDGKADGFVSVRRQPDSRVPRKREGLRRVDDPTGMPTSRAAGQGFDHGAFHDRFGPEHRTATTTTNAYLKAPGLKYGQITLRRCR